MNNIDLTNYIIAIVALTECRDRIGGGGAPVFYVNDSDKLDEVSMLIARVALGMVHEIDDGVKIIIKH
ncbi:MAG: capping complex subunit for YIEGIA [Halanaerobiaceae bacterium]